jgi:hypothetical protein
VSDNRSVAEAPERRLGERQSDVRQLAERPGDVRHPELDYAYAPNLSERHPINRQSALRPNGEFKLDIAAAVADAHKVRVMNPEERRAEDLKYALK